MPTRVFNLDGDQFTNPHHASSRLHLSPTTALAPPAPAPSAQGPNPPLPASEEQIALWAQRWMVMALEVFAGRRPRQQLLDRTSPQIYETVDRRRKVLDAHSFRGSTGAPTPVVVRSLARTVRPGVHEATVVTHDGHSVAAAALRVELFRGRLRVTALEV